MSCEPSPQPDTRVEVLIVSPCEDDHSSLRNIFRRSNWKLYEAFNCMEALGLLHEHQIPVIICERSLPDGGWKTLLDEVDALPTRPRLIVCSRLVDDQLWGEVLNLGGYDLLPTPFDAREVFRVAFLAWHSSRNEVERIAAAHEHAKSLRRAGTASRAAGTAD
jgi:DNA-binding NtrC family response regulator